MKQKFNRLFIFFKGKVISFLEKTSYKTRRSVAIVQKKEQMECVLELPEEEFLLDYEDAVARYEHSKLFFGIPVFTLFLTTIWGIVKIIAKVMNLQAVSVYSGSEVEIIQTVTMVILTILTVIVSLFFFAAARHIYTLSKKKIFYEEMKIKREGKK